MSQRWLIFGALIALSSSEAWAGEWDMERKDLDASCSSLFSSFANFGSCAAFLFNSGAPVRFTVPASVVPGGGTALGVMYAQPIPIHNWTGSNLTMDAGSSLREFWFADSTLSLLHRKWGGDWNTARDQNRFRAYAHAQGLPLLPFYGIGPDTSRSNLVDFGERRVWAGIDAFIPLKSWLAVGSALEYLAPRINGISDATVRSIDTSYSEATAPGLAHQPGFTHYRVFAQPRGSWKWTKTASQVGYDFFQDNDAGHYSFRKFRADFLQTIYPERQTEPTGGGGGTRTQPKYDSVLYIFGRFTTEQTAPGNVVPFYLQETIGGSDIDNIATLRGFQDYRFRAPNLFVIQTQYERRLLPPAKSGSISTVRKVAGALGVMGFYDAGQVALKPSDLSFSNLRQSFGFGLTFWSGERVWFRAYVGLGSGEGIHNFFGITNPSTEQFQP
jgi:hypothetical protein